MFEDEQNPYASPLTEADLLERETDATTIAGIKPRSVLVMIVLTIITIGLYINYWVHLHAKAINQHLGREQVSMVAVYLFWAVSLVAVGLIIPYSLVEEGHPVEGISDGMDIIDNIFALFMAFAIRGGLDAVLPVGTPTKQSYRGIWTFLFGIFYLQWKTNRNFELGILEQGSPEQGISHDLQAEKYGEFRP